MIIGLWVLFISFKDKPFGVETTAQAFVFHVEDDLAGNGELRFSGAEEDFEVTINSACNRQNFLEEHVTKAVSHVKMSGVENVWILFDDTAPLKISLLTSGTVFSLFLAPLAE